MTINFEFYVTISVFSIALLTIGLMNVLERRPKTTLKPSLIPTTPILYASGIVAIMAGIHLLNLLGLHTGR
jgi:hypothetical protein